MHMDEKSLNCLCVSAVNSPNEVGKRENCPTSPIPFFEEEMHLPNREAFL